MRPVIVRQQVTQRATGAEFLVDGAKDDTIDPSQQQRPATHRAGLDGDMQFATGQTLIAQRRSGGSDSDDFGMERRVAGGFTSVSPARDDGAVACDDRANRSFPLISSEGGFLQRFHHETLIIAGPINHPPLRGRRLGHREAEGFGTTAFSFIPRNAPVKGLSTFGRF